MKKILFVAQGDLGLGGIQSVIMSIVRGLKNECKFDVIVFSHNRTEYESEFLSQGKIFTIQRYEGASVFRRRLDFYIHGLPWYLKLKKIIKENGPYDVIHCNNDFNSGFTLKAAKKCGIPIRIIHSHGYQLKLRRHYVRRLYETIYKKMIRYYATNFVACSEFAADYLYGKEVKAQIIPNMINLNMFPFYSSPAINPWSFVHVGRYGETKNQLFLIDVFNLIHEKKISAKLTLVGYSDPAYKLRVDEKIVELGLQDNVCQLPGDSDIPYILAQNNVFLFPSCTEGLGISLIEAQAIGLKCFASTGVPPESNLGLVDFLPLELGAQKWAAAICKYVAEYQSIRTKVDLSLYDDQNIADVYRKLYKL